MRSIELDVSLRLFQGGTGCVDTCDFTADARQMQGKPALITEDIERAATGILGCRRIVLALVEKGSGLLSRGGIVDEFEAVHLDGSLHLLAIQRAIAKR